MKLLRSLDSLPQLDNAVVTVGSFDGVHHGHRTIIKRVTDLAQRVNGQSVVVTFDPHPRHVLEPDSNMRLLSTLDEKSLLLSDLGVNYLIAIPFTKELSRVSWIDFVSQYLVGSIGAKHLIVGYNHHFGRNKEGNFDSLAGLRQTLGISVDIQPREDIESHKVSSTIMREIIASGDMTTARRYLTMPYIVMGRVRGNCLSVDKHKLLPADGEYRVEAVINGLSNKNIVSIKGNTLSFLQPMPEADTTVMFL